MADNANCIGKARSSDNAALKRYVIIGNGAAAVGCVEGIRLADPLGLITIISEERRHVYCRPLISYYLEDKTDLEKMKYRDDGFYDRNGAEVLYGKKALSIDPAAKTVALDSGETVAYDELCVAAGSSPFVPPFKGLETVENKFGFMTLDDALGLEKVLTPETRVLIVGAGLIGLKCAEGIASRVKEIKVCDLADRILSSILDAEGAGLVQKRLEERGIKFMLSDSVSEFQGRRALMKSGREAGFDVLVLAVGVRANSGLVKEAGGSVNRGIIVDERLKTSLGSVYAAGDCAEGYDVTLGANRVLALMPSAYLEGRTAGINMAGGDAVLDNEFPMNSIGFFGFHIMTAGTYAGEVEEFKDGDSVERFYLKDGYLSGFIIIGRVERAGIYTSLIRDRVPLETVRPFIAGGRATNAMFSEEVRRKKFGGVV